MASFGTVTGSDLIAKSLEIEGVDTVFTLAGDHILPTLDCMSDRGFRFIDTRHEQAAAHMADAWGRITGRPGVAMYTTPGFANAMPGLANAMHSGSPLLSISGSAELHELGRGAMQEIDQVGHGAARHQVRLDGDGRPPYTGHDRDRAKGGVRGATRACASDYSGRYPAAGGG